MTSFNGRELRTWRLESGMTPEQVCVAAEVSYTYLRSLEDGAAKNPTIALLTRIAAVYGRDIRDLFTDHDEPMAGAR